MCSTWKRRTACLFDRRSRLNRQEAAATPSFCFHDRFRMNVRFYAMLSIIKLLQSKPHHCRSRSSFGAFFRANLIRTPEEWPTFERICGEIAYDALQHFDFGTTIV
jgi:hypothetical protein